MLFISLQLPASAKASPILPGVVTVNGSTLVGTDPESWNAKAPRIPATIVSIPKRQTSLNPPRRAAFPRQKTKDWCRRWTNDPAVAAEVIADRLVRVR